MSRKKEMIFNLSMAVLAILIYNVACRICVIISCSILGNESFNNHTNMIDTFLATMLFIVFAVWLYRIHKNEQNTTAVVNKSYDKRILFSIPIVALGMNGISNAWILSLIIGLKQIPLIAESMQSFEEVGESVNVQPYVWTLLSVIVIGPIVEEVLFRGLVFHYLEKIKVGWFPILVSGIVFGLWHREPVQCVYATILGIGIGIVYAKVRDLKVVIAIHMLNNFIVTLPPSINTDNVQTVFMCLSFIMILPAVLILYFMMKSQKKEMAQVEEIN